ncbi:MAG: helix-turn-helix domain-containing protein [Thermoplasmata archaeon]|nr:helix-turn-helix domain-containing protein [Thermoplasmata archaeon]
MEKSRERAIGHVRSLLERAGFYVSDAHAIRPSSFDLLGRRDSLLVMVKVLKNIDALDPGEARRLQELAGLFPAIPFVVGHSSGTTPLEPGVLYNRYNLPIISAETLEEYVGKGIPPFLVSSPGGIFAKVDGERLRALRELHRLSLGALASVAGVSRRTIQLYEEGAGAEISVVERIETYLGEPIVRALDLFAPPEPDPRLDESEEKSPAHTTPPTSTGDPVRDGVFRSLDGMGWQVTVTVRCPFDAFTQGPSRNAEEILLTSVGSLRAAHHRSEVLQQLARVAEGHALFVVQELTNPKPIDGMAVLTVRELKRHRDRTELLDAISERETA